MSLLDKGFSLKKLLKPGWIIFIPVFFGCETSDDQGIRYDLEANTSVRFQEFTLPVTNFYKDSLATGNENRVLVGSYADPLYGEATAEGYFQYFYNNGPLPNDSLTIDTLTFPLKYDSVELILKVDDFAFSPSMSDSTQAFSVRELTNNLITGVDYLAALKQETSGSIGTFSKKILPDADSVYQIKLSDTFGQALFNQLALTPTEEEATLSSKVFTNLGLVPETGSQSISMLGLSADTTQLILHVSSDTSALDSAFQIRFTISGQNYTYLERDQAGSAFDGVEESADVDLPDGIGVLDPLLGIYPAFSITELEDFYEENPDVIINSAVISLQTDPDYPNTQGRSQISQFITFLRKIDGSIFGPAVRTETYRNLLLTDNGYRSGNPSPQVSQISEDSDRLLIRSTLFAQVLLQEYLDNAQLALPTNQNQASRTIDELVPVGPVILTPNAIIPIDVTLSRTIFAPEGIKLRIYYTEVN